MSLGDRTWKSADRSHFRSIQRYLAEIPSIDLVERHAPAIAMGRQGLELTRTTVIAVAVAELQSVNFPIDRADGLLLWNVATGQL